MYERSLNNSEKSNDDGLSKAFKEVYARGVWGPGSGYGSQPQGLSPYLMYVTGILNAIRPKHVIDFGCGYFEPFANLPWAGVDYTGIDLVEQCIHANQPYANEHRRFLVGDFLKLSPELPSADVIFCKDVLQHLPTAGVIDALECFSKHTLCIITNSIVLSEIAVNTDIGAGDVRPLDLRLHPFHLVPTSTFIYDITTNPEKDVKLVLVWKPHNV